MALFFGVHLSRDLCSKKTIDLNTIWEGIVDGLQPKKICMHYAVIPVRVIVCPCNGRP